MRSLKIVCVGKIKEKYFNEGIDLYGKEIRRSVPLEILECPDEPTPERASVAQEDAIRLKEGRRILQKIQSESKDRIRRCRTKFFYPSSYFQ